MKEFKKELLRIVNSLLSYDVLIFCIFWYAALKCAITWGLIDNTLFGFVNMMHIISNK